MPRVDKTDTRHVHDRRAIDREELWLRVDDKRVEESVSLLVASVGLVVDGDLDEEDVGLRISRNLALDLRL